MSPSTGAEPSPGSLPDSPGAELRRCLDGPWHPRDGARFLREGRDDDPAFVFDNGPAVTVGALRAAAAALREATGGARRLFALVLENRPGPLTACFAALAGGHAVVVVPPDQPALLDHVVSTFDVNGILGATVGDAPFEPPRLRHARDLDLHPDLALMLSTSGSTGDTRFVRLSWRNLLSNGLSIADYLGLDAGHRPLLALPAHYSYGLSVLTSHRLVGAPVLVTAGSIVDDGVQAFLRRAGATSLCGVPHTYALLDGIGFFDEAPPPSLRLLTQAGGRLPEAMARRLAAWSAARQVSVVLMYGQTEASPRIAWLPPEALADHPDCIGRAIPGGRIELRDDAGRLVERIGEEGELVYHGPNVMMGYASVLGDLAAPPGDPVLATGDLAQWVPGGLLRITGRRSRIVKLFGLRLALDQIERRLEAQGVHAVCVGDDERLRVMAERADPALVRDRVAAIAGVPPTVVHVERVDALPLLPSGKPDLRRVATLMASATQPSAASPAVATPGAEAAVDDLAAVRAVFMDVLQCRHLAETDTFATLGGDSLTFVSAAMRLQPLLGTLPRQWERQTLAQLARRARAHREGGKVERTGTSMEAALLIRAVAPLLVVLNHAGLSWLAGGAALLLAVAGYNVSRFQFTRLLQGEFAAPLLGFVRNVLVPFWLVVGAWQLLKQQPNLPELLLVSNFVPTASQAPSPFGTWFVEVLAQSMVLLFVLCALPPFRRYAQEHAYRFALVLVAVGIALHGAELLVPDARQLEGRTPTWVVWIFAVGLLMHASRSIPQRLLTSVLVVVLPVVMFPGDPSRIAILAVGCLWLLWIDQVRVPAAVMSVAATIASASLFIYMLHARAPVDSFTAHWPVDVVRVGVGVLLGLAAWWIYERTIGRWLASGLERARVDEDDRHVGGPSSAAPLHSGGERT